MRNDGKSGIRKRFSRVWSFLAEDVWDVEISSLSTMRRVGVNAVRIFHLIFRGYRDDECPLHAAALTFNTLMSFVPVLALSLSIAKGFGAGDVVQSKIRNTIYSQLGQFQAEQAVREGTGAAPPAAVTNLAASVDGAAPEETVALADDTTAFTEANSLVDQIDGVLEQVFGYVENINFAALGGVGLAVLLWSVLSVLGRVESSFNRVWGVTAERSLLRKFTDYLGVLLLAPILILFSSSIPVISLTRQFLPETLAAFVTSLLESDALQHLTVVALVSLSFTVFIMVMPNTRVRFGSGFCGGLVAGLLFILWMWICVRVQVGAARAGTIYGSFAIVPILLLWVLISWHIVLFGAEVAFAVQNCTTFRAEQTARRASTESRIVLALSIVSEATRAFKEGEGAWDARAFARQKSVPVRLLNEVLDELSAQGYLGEIAERPGVFAMLKFPDSISRRDIVEAMMKSGVDPETLGLHRLRADSENLLPEAWRDAGEPS